MSEAVLVEGKDAIPWWREDVIFDSTFGGERHLLETTQATAIIS